MVILDQFAPIKGVTSTTALLVYNHLMPSVTPHWGRTYFGIASLILAMTSLLLLAGGRFITVLDISAETFSNWNNLIYLAYCISAPLALGLGVWSFTRKNDFTVPSVIGMGLVTLPFLFLFWQFVNALILYN